jgi:glycosyltransferase involved in cell wall biosynthesis
MTAAGDGILWVSCDNSSPHPYLVESARRAGVRVRDLRWVEAQDGERPLGRMVTLGRRRAGREHPITLKVVGPRLLRQFARAPEDVIVVYELGLVGLYAGLSKLLRRHRRVVSLVEGDYQHLGRTGTAGFKLPVRRLAARLVDVFVANNQLARDYLAGTLQVPDDKIVVGWWLAGLPPDLTPTLPAAAPMPEGTPLFVSAGRLIPPKGVDLLLEAVAAYRREFGPCMLWVIGDGPERASLVELARRLKVEDSVAFLGPVDHAGFKGALQACQAFVFPTLRDFIGRVAVEALTTGAPVVVSPMTGAVGTIIQDGVNGIVVDPRDARALAAAMHRLTDPGTARALRQGVRRLNPPLLPDAAADAVLGAVARARGRGRPATATRPDHQESQRAPQPGP